MKRPYRITVKLFLNHYNKPRFDANGDQLESLYIMITFNRNTSKIPTNYYITRKDFEADRIPNEVRRQVDLVNKAVKYERDKTSIHNIKYFSKRFKFYQENAVTGLLLFQRAKIDQLLLSLVLAKQYYQWKSLSLRESVKEGIKLLQEKGELSKLKAVDPLAKLSEEDKQGAIIDLITNHLFWTRQIGLVDYVQELGKKKV